MDEHEAISIHMGKINFRLRSIGADHTQYRYTNKAVREGIDIIDGMLLPFAVNGRGVMHYGYELVGNETRRAVEIIEQIQQDYAIDRLWAKSKADKKAKYDYFAGVIQ